MEQVHSDLPLSSSLGNRAKELLLWYTCNILRRILSKENERRPRACLALAGCDIATYEVLLHKLPLFANLSQETGINLHALPSTSFFHFPKVAPI